MKKTVVLIVILLILVTACGRKEQAAVTKDNYPGEEAVTVTKGADPGEEKVTFTKDTYPRVDGSTVTIPLSEAMASRLLAMSKEEAVKYVRHNTTHNAYVNLIEGKADIIFVTEPSSGELKLAREKNVELVVTPVVKDAFVFLVNVNNPQDSLTVEQVQGIYQGKIKSWKEVGGQDKEIIPYQRPRNSGSQTIMENMVMKNLTMMEAPREFVPAGMGDLIEAVAGYRNSDRALGYSVYYFAKTMYNKDTMKLLGINGTKPEKAAITSGKYPFSIDYYAVIRKSDPEGAPARKLLKWLLGKEGQDTAEKAGYVPVK